MAARLATEHYTEDVRTSDVERRAIVPLKPVQRTDSSEFTFQLNRVGLPERRGIRDLPSYRSGYTLMSHPKSHATSLRFLTSWTP
jgi:hypothetical protein